VNRLLREYLGRVGHVSLDLVQFGLEIESGLDALGLDCFPSLWTINMYLMTFVKEENVITFCNNTLAQRRP